MKRIITILFVICLVGSTMLSALCLNDLELIDKDLVKDYLIEHVEEITPINVEDLEGEEYDILAVGEDYVIVIVGEYIFIIEKE